MAVFFRGFYPSDVPRSFFANIFFVFVFVRRGRVEMTREWGEGMNGGSKREVIFSRFLLIHVLFSCFIFRFCDVFIVFF